MESTIVQKYKSKNRYNEYRTLVENGRTMATGIYFLTTHYPYEKTLYHLHILHIVFL